jgi:hypothetical protein
MVIRKISIGADYKSSMNYIIGQDVINNSHKIHEITTTSEGWFYVWIISHSKEVVKWKAFSPTMPVSVEYNIDF